MDFGKRMLMKQGWSEGDSLGKNGNGIVNPIKASFKFDNSGFGTDIQKQVSGNHWWERVYSEASNNLKIENTDNKISVKAVEEDGVELTNKTYSMKKIKENHGEMTYGSFLKSSTLLANVGEEVPIPGHITTDDIEINEIPVIPDHVLFSACEGRTAHKGARHGLSLSGKLARLEEQDRLLMEKINNHGKKLGIFKEADTKKEDDDGFTVVKSKKKKKNKQKMDLDEEEPATTSAKNDLDIDDQSDLSNPVYIKKSKKKEKRDKKMEKSLAEGFEDSMNILENQISLSGELEKIQKKKKKKKDNELEEAESFGTYRDSSESQDKICENSKSERKYSKTQLKRIERRKRKIKEDVANVIVDEKPKKRRLDSSGESSSSPDVLLKVDLPNRKKWSDKKRYRKELENGNNNDGDIATTDNQKATKSKNRGSIKNLSEKMEIAARLEDHEVHRIS